MDESMTISHVIRGSFYKDFYQHDRIFKGRFGGTCLAMYNTTEVALNKSSLLLKMLLQSTQTLQQ